MAKKTETTYWCDSCAKPKERKELRRFTLTEHRMGGERVAGATTELCTGCEMALHEAALPFFPLDEAENLRGVVRP